MYSENYNWCSKDGTKLYACRWSSGNEARAVLMLIHGIGEYSERYHDWVSRFVSKNIDVMAVDYRGHGKSGGERGYISSYEDLMQDIDVLKSNISAVYKNIPVLIYGHSMGGNIALNYILRQPCFFKAAIIGSPWLKLYFPPSGILNFMVRIINKVYPSYAQKAPLRKSDLTHNAEIVEVYKKDPLVHKRITARLYCEMTDAAEFALANAGKINIPVLIMHGSDDHITSPKGSILFSEKAQNATLKIWENDYHELHNETNNAEIFEFVYGWILKTIGI